LSTVGNDLGMKNASLVFMRPVLGVCCIGFSPSACKVQLQNPHGVPFGLPSRESTSNKSFFATFSAAQNSGLATQPSPSYVWSFLETRMLGCTKIGARRGHVLEGHSARHTMSSDCAMLRDEGCRPSQAQVRNHCVLYGAKKERPSSSESERGPANGRQAVAQPAHRMEFGSSIELFPPNVVQDPVQPINVAARRPRVQGIVGRH
jgi:hypothetical protein